MGGKMLGTTLKKSKKELNREEDFSFVENLLRYSKGFWKGLLLFIIIHNFQGLTMI
jgi:hypothetical protein